MPLSYYQDHFKMYKAEAERIYKKMTVFSFYRVATFVITGFGVYFAFEHLYLALLIGGTGLAVFMVLLLKYTDLKHLHQFKSTLAAINEEELKIGSGSFLHRDEGLEFQDPGHYYSSDIDLFGRGSFFQFINRTALKEGTEHLVKALKANSVEDIVIKQEAVKELSKKPKWRQYYQATSSVITIQTPAEDIISWLKNHRPFLPKTMRWIPLVFTVLSIIFIALTAFQIITSPLVLANWLLIGLLISGGYLKKVNLLAYHTDKVRNTFKQYALLLDYIESETFSSELLIQKQQQIQSESLEASKIFKVLSRSLNALDNRNNLIGAIFGNGYFLNDIRNSYKIEQWIVQYADKVEDWFKVVSFFDAYNTLGNYAFNHPGFVFPEIKTEGPVIVAKDLGHPLLDESRRVDSHVRIDREEFFIVTGANMAGKSTFLRTVSLHIVMANMGLPVCAKKSTYCPIKLITSMRTRDSLTDDSSYFFSELSRLKFIVDKIEKAPYFIVLDEILKGTNSTDKAIGSRKFIEKLVETNATGIIATHDLSLCELEKEFAEVRNYFFEAKIVNGELYFDYKLKQGICKNMNASFLLKKMNIV
ncbi:MutS-related protein [Aestuariivivens sediminicola]|uniref:MutS-related protein n=1 Tax=Aestuariivivens sediminicola TaxID=2913560 RepID=UPI001F58681E|nr:DNA mismatch repair protein MutS [Aestuariivivens sediminicola]